MATSKKSKSSDDTKRNAKVHALAFKWLEQNREDVIKACRAAADKEFPRSTKSRIKTELTQELKELK